MGGEKKPGIPGIVLMYDAHETHVRETKRTVVKGRKQLLYTNIVFFGFAWCIASYVVSRLAVPSARLQV